MKNTPYIKEYNTEGVLTNPIKGAYINQFPTRKNRRVSKERFFGNGKNTPLTIFKNSKFLRVRQIIKGNEGKKKTIEHYILK